MEAATHSPVVGEKRQREEDEEQEPQDQLSNGSKDASQEPQSIPSSVRSPNLGTNGSFGNSAMSMPGAGGQSSGQNSDALYIGDLQWVRPSSSSVLVYVGLRRTVCITFSSGPPMRTCARLPQSLVSTWITRTSPSLSTR